MDNFDELFLIRFDANLSEKGVQEAESGGKALKDAGYTFDIAHTSLLTRAQVTLGKVLQFLMEMYSGGHNDNSVLHA